MESHMANGNTVVLVGNLTDDPELRFTSSGQALAKFTLAVNRRWQNRSTNEWQEDTSFIRCTCWGEQAERIAESLQKGARTIVTGRLQENKWETKEGEKRSTIEINVDECGPSLKWATATVTKAQRKGGGDGDWAGPPQGAGGDAGDDEPF